MRIGTLMMEKVQQRIAGDPQQREVDKIIMIAFSYPSHTFTTSIVNPDFPDDVNIRLLLSYFHLEVRNQAAPISTTSSRVGTAVSISLLELMNTSPNFFLCL